ncbi:hypothetical protein AVCANL279_07280 [Campylobacter canadensis]|uniref:hypothetical protein n=1 Tax=Campylobacter canadensis TaxID=449520 RepID=UPI001556E0D2|nr:hypothetical protein [Campylobacter canadensis]MBZ7995183.1 hypothetical protein [Campylobacter canadensis]MBZ7997120.1 hypothetical protein [Campylobacter canadensis]MBZ8000547.1 hypothetical protein [Campylobacter canadensis]MBZ8003858.1 hypothetical protein [Campylobacter canadensis]
MNFINNFEQKQNMLKLQSDINSVKSLLKNETNQINIKINSLEKKLDEIITILKSKEKQ